MESSFSRVEDIVIIISKFVIVFLIGALSGVLIDPYLPAFLSNAKKGYQSGNIAGQQAGYKDGFAAARKLVEDSNLGSFFRSPQIVRTLSGTIIATSSDSITIRTQLTNPFDDPKLSERKVLIATTTKVVQQVVKDPVLFKKEMSAFTREYMRLSTASSTSAKAKELTPPTPYVEATTTLSSLKIGDSVDIISLKNIKDIGTFEAYSVALRFKMFSK